MLKQLHLYDEIYNTREIITINFNLVQYFKPNSVCTNHTDIYFSNGDRITVWENYESLLK